MDFATVGCSKFLSQDSAFGAQDSVAEVNFGRKTRILNSESHDQMQRLNVFVSQIFLFNSRLGNHALSSVAAVCPVSPSRFIHLKLRVLFKEINAVCCGGAFRFPKQKTN